MEKMAQINWLVDGKAKLVWKKNLHPVDVADACNDIMEELIATQKKAVKAVVAGKQEFNPNL